MSTGDPPCKGSLLSAPWVFSEQQLGHCTVQGGPLSTSPPLFFQRDDVASIGIDFPGVFEPLGPAFGLFGKAMFRSVVSLVSPGFY